MNITIHRGRRPDLPAADVRVVIDVIRAFTTTQVALEGGASRILLAGTVEEARALAAARPGRLLAGERDAIAPPGFDLGNSPAEFDGADLGNRELVLTTSNGVQATLHAWQEGPVVVTGFGNAGSTVRFLEAQITSGAKRIQLLASHPEGDEDLACAQWIRARLVGESEPDDSEVIRRIRESGAARKFLDLNRPEYDPTDVEYCARRVDSLWVMEVRRRSSDLIVERRELNWNDTGKIILIDF
jgi:2-phosphosulfolactate phosphatase